MNGYIIFIVKYWTFSRDKSCVLSFRYLTIFNDLEGENIEYDVTYEEIKKIAKIHLNQRTYNNTML